MLAAALVLACVGGGTAVKPDSSTMSAADSNGNFITGSASGTRDRAFTDQVDVELTEDGGRIRLPRTTLPVVRGGNDGWFQLRNIRITDRAITATAAVNFMNKPRVHIDRVTGTITINGMNGDFSGRCERVDPEAERRF